MSKVRSLALAAAVGALFTGKAIAAEEPGDWNTKYGLLFTVQNVFQNGSPSTLGDLGGSVGLQYNLSTQRALRLSVNVSRASNVGTENKTTNLVTGTTTSTYTPPAPFSSRYGVGLGATYMMRLSNAALAPYLGAGGRLGYARTALAYTDDVTTANPNVVDVDNLTSTWELGADGVLGLEWRLHKSLSLFAEYMLDVSLVSYSSTANKTTNTSKATGAMATGTKAESSATRYLNFSTGLGQGGLIGLVAFF